MHMRISIQLIITCHWSIWMRKLCIKVYICHIKEVVFPPWKPLNLLPHAFLLNGVIYFRFFLVLGCHSQFQMLSLVYRELFVFCLWHLPIQLSTIQWRSGTALPCNWGPFKANYASVSGNGAIHICTAKKLSWYDEYLKFQPNLQTFLKLSLVVFVFVFNVI